MTSKVAKICRVAVWTLVGLLLLPFLLMWIATLWLTPDRLTRFINEEGSKTLGAEVRAYGADYTFWSTFPDLRVHFDSLSIRSDAFRNLPAEARADLPADADLLLAADATEGSVDVPRIVGGKISLYDISVDRLRLNLVQANDSTTNYNLKSIPRPGHIPEIAVSRLDLRNLTQISYTSVPAKTAARVVLDSLAVRHFSDTIYRLDMAGAIDLDMATANAAATPMSDLTRVLDKFPVNLSGNVGIGQDPFRIQTRDFEVALANLRVMVDMDADLTNDPALSLAECRVADFSVPQLLAEVNLPQLREALSQVKLELPLNATARLRAPYRFSQTVPPSVEASVGIPRGKVVYTPDNGTGNVYTLNQILLGATLDYDGARPDATQVRIGKLHLSGEGLNLTADGTLSGFEPESVLHLDADLGADMQKVASFVADIGPQLPAIKGDINLKSGIDMRLGDIAAGNFGKIKGNATITSDQLSVNSNGTGGEATDLKVDARADYDPANPTANNLRINVKGKNVKAAFPGGSARLNGVTLHLAGNMLKQAASPRNYVAPRSWNRDSAVRARAPHTAPFLTAQAPAALTALLNQYAARAWFAVDAANISTPAFPAANSVAKLRVQTNFDSLSFTGARVRSGRSAMRVKGTVTNLQQFLTSATPAPLPVTMMVNIDTLDLNDLARTYVAGLRATKGEAAVAALAHPAPTVGSDTVSLLLPRNVKVNMIASARQLDFTNLTLSGINTGINMQGGAARIDTLTADSPLGRFGVSYLYDSSDMQNLRMKAAASAADVTLSDIYSTFAEQISKVPEITCLTGRLSARLSADAMLFPNMYLILPSLGGTVNVHGSSFMVHRNNLVGKIAKMLLIPGKGSFHIADFDIRARLHDNVLELYPFYIDIPRYRLNMVGLNNFAGDIYYHIGVEKSPFHIPFGVNIKGTFRDPKLRFGGSRWKEDNATEVEAGVQDTLQINVLRELRTSLGPLILAAARYGN